MNASDVKSGCVKCYQEGCVKPAHTRGLCQTHYTYARKHKLIPLLSEIITPEERFWSRVEKTQSCWIWTASVDTNGYGQIKLNYKTKMVHNHAYNLLVGPIPAGLELDHTCRNRRCVNPAHLEPVTRKENIFRGNSPPAICARQTHCKRGHPLSGDNIYVKCFYRKCKICARECSKQLRQRKKERLLAAATQKQGDGT